MTREKNKIRVVVTYTDCLEKIEVDSRQLADIDAIRNKPISEWFLPSNDRFGWKGLLQEINNFLADEDVSLYFDFKGSEEVRQIFKEYLAKNGIDPDACLTKEEIINDAFTKANHAHANGLIKDELQYYLVAADEADYSEAQYKVAKIYMSIYKGQEKVAGISCDDGLKRAFAYYRKAAAQNHSEAQWELYKLLKDDEPRHNRVNEDIFWLSKVADSGYIEALYELGEYYYSKSNFDTAISLLEKALKNGLPDDESINAKYMLGRCFSNDACALKDTDKAEEYLVETADLGHREAQFVIGFEYYNSEDDEDSKEAVDWLKKSAVQGYSKAQYYLATCYCTGKGVDRDDEMAFSLFYKAAEQGHAQAQYTIGQCYHDGLGVDTNREQAVYWFKKAAEQKHPNAEYELAKCYSSGEGVDAKDDNAAIGWYSAAAHHGVIDAYYQLGEYLYNGVDGISYPSRALEYYTKAAEENHLDSLIKLGCCYYKGDIAEQNFDVAKRIFETALNNPHYCSEVEPMDELCIKQKKSEAKNYLGDCYFYGYNDASKALEYYLSAANEGNVEAMLNVGNCFEYGYDTPKNLTNAKKWYKKAMDEGSDEGRNNYISLIEKYAMSLYSTKIDGFYITEEIPEKILKNATVYQRKKGNSEHIIFLLDNTVFKSGKGGFILTPSSIIQHFVGTEVYNIHQIKQVASKKNKTQTELYLLFEDKSMKELFLAGTGYSDDTINKIAYMLNLMIKFLKE